MRWVLLSVSLPVSAKNNRKENCHVEIIYIHDQDLSDQDLSALDLQSHMDVMAKLGWDLVSTQYLINEDHSKTPQMMFFWSKNESSKSY